jgi:hypothetical protein
VTLTRFLRLLGLIVLLSSGAFAQISNPAFLWRPQPNPAPPPCPRIRQFYNLSGTFQQIDCNGVITTISNLSSLQDPGANGFLVRTAPNITTARTLQGTVNRINITNPDGVAGPPTFDIGSTVATSGANLSFFAVTTSAQLAGVISDESGSGALVFGTSPTIGTPTINTPTINTPTITSGTHSAITNLGIRSTGGGAFDLQINNTENLTANRALTFTLNDAARVVNLGGNLTTVGAFSTAGAFSTVGANSLAFTTTAPTSLTLPVTGTLATLAGAETLSNKTLSSPRVSTAILDSNGNEVIETPATASAVNQLRVTNSATGTPVSVSAQGGDAVVGLNLASKSTGNVVLQTNSIDKFTVNGSLAEAYFGNGITNASPSNFTLLGTGATGTNNPGAALELSGGKGTGTAEPGLVALRYPLRTASGTTLQSLSTNSYPLVTSLYTNANTPTAISNTAAETSVFTGVTPSAGSTATVEAGISRAGTKYIIRVIGLISNTGTPTIQMKVKLGSTTVIDTGAMTMPTVASGRFWITAEMQVASIGAAASVPSFGRIEWSRVVNGLATFDTGIAGSAAVVDLTTNQTFDVTLQWGTANALNVWQTFEISITRER